MKFYTLASLGLALFSGALMAQTTLPPSLRAYQERLPAAWARTLAAGELLPATPAKHSTGQEKLGNTVIPLDSTVTYVLYDNEGQDSTAYVKEIYTYPDAQTERTLSLDFSAGDWVPASRTSIHKDTRGRIIEVVGEVYDEVTGGWTPNSRLEVYPHGESEIATDSFFLYEFNTETLAYQLVLSSRSYYDENDVLIEDYTTLIFFEQELTFRDEYVYNSSGEVTLISSFLVLPEGEFLAGEEQRVYENDVLLQRVTNYVVDESGTLLPTTQETYTYGESSLVATRADFEYDSEAESWVLLDSIFYGYDDQLRQVREETRYYEDDELIQIDLVRTGYLQDNLTAVITNLYFDFGSSAFQISDRTFYYYGATSSVDAPRSVAGTLKVFPNPTSAFLFIDLPEIDAVEVFDLQGRRLLFNPSLADGRSLDISTLPRGMYTVRVLAKGQLLLGRVVKG